MLPPRKDPEAEAPLLQRRRHDRAKGVWRSFVDFLYPLSVGDAEAKKGSVRLEALDAPRWIASIQIVCYHMYSDEVPFNRYATWFAVWTQFFFMLSGFVLSYTEVVRPADKARQLSVLKYVRRRLIVIYPAYAFSLVLIIVGAAFSLTRFEWQILPLHVLLMQSWFPICTGHGADISCAAWSFNGEAWFLSVLVLYWLILRPLAAFFRQQSRPFCLMYISASWVFCIVFHLAGHYNGLAGTIGCRSDVCINCVMVALRAGPFGYFHVFTSGIAAARIFVLSAMCDAETGGPPAADSRKLMLASSNAPCALRYGCCIGYAIYVAVVLFATDLIDPYYYFFHNGGLLPVMFFLVVGAAVGEDPLAVWLFRSKPMLVLGRISYLQYLMQHIVRNQLASSFGWNQSTKIAFVPVLIVFSYLCHRFVERPATEYQRRRQESGVKGCDDRCIERLESMWDRCCSRE